MPVGKSESSVPEPWTLRVSLALSGTAIHAQHVEACPDIGPICATVPQTPYQHDQHLYPLDELLTVELGLLPHLALEVDAGMRQVTDRIRFLTLDGAPYTPPVPDDHHRNETLFGPSDPTLLAHAGATWGSVSASARAGISVPLGSTVPNPFLLGRMGLPHEHIQLGAGTWNPVVGASIEKRFDAFSAALWTLDRFTVGTDGFGYQSGDKLLAGASASSALGLSRWSFTVGLDLYRETPERWSGVIEAEGNLGRTDLMLDASVAWAFTKDWGLDLGVKVPVHSVSQGEQASYPAILTLGIATSFDLGRRP